MKLARVGLLALLPLALAPASLAQCQQTKLLVQSAHKSDAWGWAVAFDGEAAVVSSLYDRSSSIPTGPTIGAAHVFEQGPGGWSAVHRLKPSSVTSLANFGHAMALAGEWLAISAPDDHAGSVQQSGAVFVFRKLGAQWVEQQKLTALVPTYLANFGASLSLRGDRLAIGAAEDTDFGFRAGAAHIFELQAGGQWVEVAKLFAGNPQVGGVFGWSVAIDGDTLLVGSPGEHGLPAFGSNTGSTYVFERSASGTWSQVQKLVTSPRQAGQFAGAALVLEGNTVFVGSPDFDEDFTESGAVFVYSSTPGGWVQTQVLRVADQQAYLNLGYRLAFSEGRLFCGATDDEQGIGSGSIHVFEEQGTSWVQVAKVFADDGKPNDQFGVSFAASGASLLVGANRTDEVCPADPNCNSGSAYLVPLGSLVVQTCSCPAPHGPCGNHDDWGGCANSTGQGAVLSSCGSGSVQLDDLSLTARWLPSHQPAVLFMGAQIVQLPFGDGRLCIAGGSAGIYRFAAARSNAAGMLALGPGLIAQSQTFPAAGHIQPGSTWHLQLWYRDPAGPCGSGANLSNALWATFVP